MDYDKRAPLSDKIKRDGIALDERKGERRWDLWSFFFCIEINKWFRFRKWLSRPMYLITIDDDLLNGLKLQQLTNSKTSSKTFFFHVTRRHAPVTRFHHPAVNHHGIIVDLLTSDKLSSHRVKTREEKQMQPEVRLATPTRLSKSSSSDNLSFHASIFSAALLETWDKCLNDEERGNR